VARYYTPKHRSIQELGISPDVVVADAAPAHPDEVAQRGERDLKRHLKNEATPVTASAPPAAADDYQVRTAVDYLKAVDIFKASIEPPRGVASKKE
jgi:carboxyl-terminal processing protease